MGRHYYDGGELGTVFLVIGILAIFGLAFLFFNSPSILSTNTISQTTYLSAKVIKADVWTQSGGLFVGSQVHDNVTFLVSDGELIVQSFGCNYYHVGQNVSVSLTISNRRALISTTTINYSTSQAPTVVTYTTISTETSSWIFVNATTTLTSYSKNYQILNIPQGC